MDELLPLSAYHRHSDELLERGTRLGAAVAALMTGAGFLFTRWGGLSVEVALGSVLAGVAGYVVWVVLWGGTMKRLHRWQVARVYEEESRIAPDPPDGPGWLRLPMCADLSSTSKPTGGTLFVSAEELRFVPNRDQKGAPIVTIPTNGVRLEVREWLDAPRAARDLRHRHSLLDVIGPNGTHSFLTLEADTVTEGMRHLLPAAGGTKGALESAGDSRRRLGWHRA